MTTNQSYPKQMLIELSGITSLIVHALNDLSKRRMVDNKMAYQIALFALKRDIDMRCNWILVDKVNMGAWHKETMLNEVKDMPPGFVDYLIDYGDEVFIIIERAMSELLDKYIPKNTWHIWSVSAYDNFSICLCDRGDYRIAEWAQQQQLENSVFAQRMNQYDLGAEE